jgi:hypothetical protein
MPYVFDHFEFDIVTLAHIGCEVFPIGILSLQCLSLLLDLIHITICFEIWP